MRRPRKRSRTSTHAIAVPATAFTAATRTDTPSVSFSAAPASRLVTAVQNASSPWSNAFEVTAASGSSTTTLRYAVASPTASAGRPARSGMPAGRRRLRRGPIAASAASGDSVRLLDLRHHAGGGIEVLLHHGRPAAELVDRAELRRGRELRLVHQRRLHGAVALRGEDLLAGVRLEVVHERLRLRGVLRLAGDRDRVLDQDRLVRDHVVRGHALLLRRDRLVL